MYQKKGGNLNQIFKIKSISEKWGEAIKNVLQCLLHPVQKKIMENE